MEQLKYRERYDLLIDQKNELETQRIKKADERDKHIGDMILFSIALLIAIPGTIICMFCDGPGWLTIILIAFSILVGLCTKFSVEFYIDTRKKLKDLSEKLDSTQQELITEEEQVRTFEKEYHIEEVKFYLTCKDKGIDDISTEAGMARLELYAHNQHTQLSDKIIAKYKTGQEFFIKIEQKEKLHAHNQHLEKLIKQEEEFEARTKANINYTGRTKRIKMYQELAEYQRKQEEKYQKHASALFSASFAAAKAVAYEKEHDWAIAGGLANGLAGGAAGLATALEIQQKNAEIRARNSMPRDYSLATSIGDRAGTASINEKRAKEEAEKYENLAREAQNLLVENSYTLEEQRTLLAHLKPRVEMGDPAYDDLSEVEITETGAITLCVTTCPYTLKIKGSVQAVVDGYYKVIIKNAENNSTIGEAFAYLSVSGSLKQDWCYTICRANTSLKAEDLTFEFEPYNLWAIEVGSI